MTARVIFSEDSWLLALLYVAFYGLLLVVFSFYVSGLFAREKLIFCCSKTSPQMDQIWRTLNKSIRKAKMKLKKLNENLLKHDNNME